MKETYIKPKLDIIIDIPNYPGQQNDNDVQNGDIIVGAGSITGDNDNDI